MKQLIIYFVIFLAFTSCKKINIHTKKRLKGDREVLVGTYEWDSTFYSYWVVDCCSSNIESHTFMPNNVTYSIEFLKKGVVNYYRNKTILNQYNIIKFLTEEKTDTSFNFVMDLKSVTDKSINQLQIQNINSNIIVSQFPLEKKYEEVTELINYFHKSY